MYNVSTDGRMVCWSADKDLSTQHVSYANNKISVTMGDRLVLDGSVSALFLHGSVVSIVVALSTSDCVNQFSLLE